jgi:cytochrome c peroxidase
VVLAPGWRPLTFEAPTPGTYALPPLGTAADGAVLAADGGATTLYRLYDDHLVVLSLVYTRCPDPNGCPLATAVLAKLKSRLDADSALRARVAFLSLSIDPTHDTPDAMRRYGAALAAGPVPWHFLTTPSERALAPLLAAYDQAVTTDYDADGRALGTMSHVLRVFLIDRTRRIRNVYNVSFLHADTLLADLRTLALEDDAPPAAAHAGVAPAATAHTGAATIDTRDRPIHGAGDEKTGYESAAYATRSRDLAGRRGAPADLLALARTPPLGLPAVPVPADNPLTAAKIALGRTLFFDRRLSLNGTVSCAMCHVPDQGFTSNELQTAVGIEGRTVRRNAPTLYNVAYLDHLFHDGREHRLEQQIWGPLLAANEMGNPSVGHVLATVAALPDYDGLFETAFAGRGPDMLTLGAALASYERTLLAADAPFDRWRFGGDAGALDAAAVRGFALFTGKARCAACHTVAADHALFTDDAFHDTGVGYRASMTPEPATRRVQVAPGVALDVATASYAAAAEPRPADLGRYEITQDPADRWRYRTPSLRNVALTAPYMHDGSLPTLRAVVEFYNAGGVPHALLDPRLRPLGLSAGEIDDLVALLASLTGATVDTVVRDAFAAPIGDVGTASGR